MNDSKEQLRRGTPPAQIDAQSKPVKEDDPAEGEEKSTGTSGGKHKTGVAGRRPVGKGR